MAYRHAWVMVDELNRCFAEPVVAATIGGREGGGAELTPWGEELVARFQEMDRLAGRAIARHLSALDRHLAGAGASR
jgi:molybdate transport system regulatory protein